jgi:hypothetical protein
MDSNHYVITQSSEDTYIATIQANSDTELNTKINRFFCGYLTLEKLEIGPLSCNDPEVLGFGRWFSIMAGYSNRFKIRKTVIY